MGVSCRENPPTQATMVWVLESKSHHLFGDASFSIVVGDEHVADPAEGRPIGNHPKIGNLGIS